MQHERPTAAVCFSGWQGRTALPDRGASIRENLIRPLNADAIASFHTQHDDECTSSASCSIHDRLRAMLPFTRLDLWRMQTIEELVASMESLPHWPQVAKAYRQGGKIKCQRTPGWRNATEDGPPYRCEGLFHSNTIFSPVIGSTYNLLELQGLHRCYGALESVENMHAMRYERVVHTRIEYFWLHPHPPLSLLDPAHVWLPFGEDYGGGVNDRHAVLNRRAARSYFTRWQCIMSEQCIMSLDPQLRSGVVRNAYAAQGDFFLRATLRRYNHSVRRFAGVAALRCCDGKCFSHACYKRALPTSRAVRSLILAQPSGADLEADADAVARSAFGGGGSSRNFSSGGGGDSSDEIMTKTFGSVKLGLADLASGKYRDELEMAIQHTIALRLPGGRFVLRPVANRKPEMLPPKTPAVSPLELCVATPVHLIDAFRNATLALRIAERIAMGHDGLVGAGRRRKLIVLSSLLQWY